MAAEADAWGRASPPQCRALSSAVRLRRLRRGQAQRPGSGSPSQLDGATQVCDT